MGKKVFVEGATVVRARVLFAGAWGAVNSVVSVSPEEALAGELAGELDSSEGAVAYADSLVSSAAAGDPTLS